jgi:hypothetical protein
MSDEQDLLAGGGPKLPSLKFEKIGDVHSGIVLDVKKLEDRDPAGVAKTWPNGDPKFVYVINLKTENNGDSALWARGAMITAIREAAKQASVTELTGNRISVKYSGDGEKKAGFNAPKLFAAKVEKVATDDRW